MTDRLTADLAATVRAARTDLNLSVNALAESSGVSRAMIAKIERAEVQPTAALLGRLSAALGLTLSELFARTEGATPRLARHADQILWTDPRTGYRRRSVSPAGSPVQLVEVELPAGAEVSYPAESYALADHQIWVLAGRLRFREGAVDHELEAGDCLTLGTPAPGTYQNVTDQPCRYLVVLNRGRNGTP
ncbi:helix-turn-helix domain-containing protein [Actinoplanes sp. NEAU-A12]|uniref:Helix-turn-helix domain-containing protein n=1 Tax=Actinoplanes sandaracinus TaxID=3045177 RepID=A0ABT6WUS2_9ACTN|nr:helix-turn-helix domain-containing protein [Actinoplanes sandaracinus]MDI6103502.1 helix-turn-helix domain-containing protein [Actinoplanes sandaracinus]